MILLESRMILGSDAIQVRGIKNPDGRRTSSYFFQNLVITTTI
jgi:hypothetical protein